MWLGRLGDQRRRLKGRRRRPLLRRWLGCHHRLLLLLLWCQRALVWQLPCGRRQVGAAQRRARVWVLAAERGAVAAGVAGRLARRAVLGAQELVGQAGQGGDHVLERGGGVEQLLEHGVDEVAVCGRQRAQMQRAGSEGKAHKLRAVTKGDAEGRPSVRRAVTWAPPRARRSSTTLAGDAAGSGGGQRRRHDAPTGWCSPVLQIERSVSGRRLRMSSRRATSWATAAMRAVGYLPRSTRPSPLTYRDAARTPRGGAVVRARPPAGGAAAEQWSGLSVCLPCPFTPAVQGGPREGPGRGNALGARIHLEDGCPAPVRRLLNTLVLHCSRSGRAGACRHRGGCSRVTLGQRLGGAPGAPGAQRVRSWGGVNAAPPHVGDVQAGSTAARQPAKRG